MELVNQTLENLNYEIRCYSQGGVQYTNLLCDNIHDVNAIYKLYTEVLGYVGVQVWHDGQNITDTVKMAKLVFVKKPK